jgi:phosphoglycolate phosphatase-like HAD superfamily hydrolase
MTYKVLVFDFDGVINLYRGEYKGDDVHAAPNPEVLRAMGLLREQGYKILIYSTKSTATIKKYCGEHAVPYDYINENPDQAPQGNPHKPRAGAYIDDHAICYRGQSAGDLVKEITTFVPYYRKTPPQ